MSMGSDFTVGFDESTVADLARQMKGRADPEGNLKALIEQKAEYLTYADGINCLYRSALAMGVPHKISLEYCQNGCEEPRCPKHYEHRRKLKTKTQ